MANYDDVVEQNKKYLTQAQINALAAASKEYNVQNAGNRAGALASAREQLDVGYRGLQNMGLAGGLEAQATSGEVPRLQAQVQTNFDRYNQKLSDVEHQRLSALGANMAAQTQAARAAAAAAQRARMEAAGKLVANSLFDTAKKIGEGLVRANAGIGVKKDIKATPTEQYDEPVGPLTQKQYMEQQQRQQQFNTTLAAAQVLGVSVPNLPAQMKGEKSSDAYKSAVVGAALESKKNPGKAWKTTPQDQKQARQNVNQSASVLATGTGYDTAADKQALTDAENRLSDLKQKRHYGGNVTDDELNSAQAAVDTAKMKVEQPQLYAAYVVYNDAASPVSARKNAAHIIAEDSARKVTEAMGYTAPSTTDEEFKENAKLIPQLRRALNVIDSQRIAQENKRKTGTTGADYEQYDIDDNIAELKKLGFTEQEARDFVKKFDNDRYAKRDYDAFASAYTAYFEHNGEKPSKGVNSTETDATYRAINNLPDMDYDPDKPTATRQNRVDPYVEYMTPDERAAYNNIYWSDGVDAANKYAEDIKPIVELQRADSDRAYLEQLAREKAIPAWLLARGTNLVGNIPAMAEKFVTGAQNVVSDIASGGATVPTRYSYDSSVSRFSNWADIIQSEQSRNILQHYDEQNKPGLGKVMNFVYQTGTSMADSAIAMVISGAGAPWMTDALFFSSAGNQAYKDIIERGGTQEQAMASGVLNGVAEALFEHVSIEHFLEDLKFSGPKAVQLIKSMLSQGGTEASEEVCTEIVDILTDVWVMDDKSEFEQLKKEYGERGAYMELLKDVGMAGLGGLASGLGFGALSMLRSAPGDIRNRVETNKIGEQVINSNGTQRLIDTANILGGDAATLASKASKKQTSKTVGDLAVAVNNQQKALYDIENADAQTAVTRFLDGGKMDAFEARTIMDTIGADTIGSMGYDVSSPRAFKNSYNARLEEHNIKSNAELMSKIGDKLFPGYMSRMSSSPSSFGFTRSDDLTNARAQQKQQAAYTAARANAANNVWANPEQGMSIVSPDGRTISPMPGNMTAVEQAEQERTGFKARATATKGNVTYAVAGMEARHGLSNEQIYAEIQKGLTKEARQKARLYEKLAEALGVKMIIHDVMTGTNGFIDENGNMHVVLSGRQSVLRVAAHELTHYIKNNAKAEYSSLRSHLIAEVGQDKFDRMLKQKAREYGIDLSTENGKTLADDEVCAELCERMLSNEDALEKFAEKETSAAKTLKEHLLKILNAIKSAFKRAENRDFGESWSDLIKSQDTIENWVTSLQKAIDNAEKRASTVEGAIAKTAGVTTVDQAHMDDEMRDELFLSEEDKARAERKKQAESNAEKGTDVRGISAKEMDSVLSNVMVGNKSNYEGDDYEHSRAMIAQLVPEVIDALNGEANLDDVQAKLETAVGEMVDNYFEEYGDGLPNLRSKIDATIGINDQAKGEIKYSEKNMRKVANEISHALGKRVTLVGETNPKFKTAQKLDSLWEAMNEDEVIDQKYNWSTDVNKLVDFINDQSADRVKLTGKERENTIYAQVGEMIAAVSDMLSEKTGKRYSLDTDAIRQAFTIIDTAGIEDGLEALKDVKHVGSFALKDITRFLDASAGKNKDLRNTLHAIFEAPHSEATGRYAKGVERMQERVLDIAVRSGVVSEKDVNNFRRKIGAIRFDSKKSAAIQNIGEGFSNTYTDLKLKVKDADHVTVRAYEPGTDNLVDSEKDYTLKELRQAYGTNAADYVWSRVFDETQKAQETGGKPGWVDEKVNTRPYTIDDLQTAYPNDWQKLKGAADEFRQMYDEYIRDQNNMLSTIYPIESEYADVEKLEAGIEKKHERLARHKAAVETQIANLQKSLEAKEKEIASKKRTDTKAYRQLVEQAGKLNDQIAAVKAEIMEYESNVKDELVKMNTLKAEMQNAVQKGDYSLKRMHRLQYRSDYFHHFTEMASGIHNLKSIFTNNTDIAPAIVGKSENTKAKTKWAGYFQQRMGGDYTADALSGMLRYGQLAEYKLAFDPLTAYLRDVNKQIRDMSDDTNRDGLIRYIDQWADTIAGKSHKLDRVVSDSGMAPRKAMQVLQWINSRVIQNTLLWNMRSALIQISNITNAKGIVKNNIDWVNGLKAWALAVKGDEAMASIMAQSNFLASRYMDGLALTDSKLKSAKQLAGWMLGALDEVSAKATWWAAYQQYTRNPNAAKNQYRNYEDAIDYADDITRRTHAGRGVGELAPAMTSRVINFVAPFQVEVNNTWQLLKDNVKQKNYLGLLSTGLSVFLFNSVFESIVGSTPLGFDFIRAVVDIVMSMINDDPDDDPDAKEIGQRFAGELVGGLPFASQLVAAFGEDNAKKLLGENNDATRYGNTQIGVNAVVNAVKGLKDIGSGLIEGRQVNWIDDLDDLLNLTLPMGAKQLTRTAQGIATVAKGYAGKYDNKGDEKVQFVTDRDFLHYLHAGLFGKWALPEASEYFGEKRLIPELFGKYHGPKSSMGKPVDAKEYKAAIATGIGGKDYFTLKYDLKEYTTQAGKRAEMAQQKFTPEQKAQLDALMIVDSKKESKTKDGVVYQKNSKDEWEVKADYTNDAWLEVAELGNKQYEQARGGVIVGIKPAQYVSIYNAFKGMSGNDKKEQAKAYLDSLHLSKDAYDYIWTVVFGYKKQ